MVAIRYKPCGLRVEFVCEGPDERARCPYVAPGQVVPCAGRKLALSKDELAPHLRRGRYRISYRVTVDETACPLVAMDPEAAGPIGAYSFPYQ